MPQRNNDGAREAQRESPAPRLPQCIKSGDKARSRRSVHIRCEAGSPVTVAANFRSGKKSAPGCLPSSRPFGESLRRKAGPSVADDERARLQDRRKPTPMKATAGAAKGCGHRSRLLRRVPHRCRFAEPVRDFRLVIQS
ncbi:hypothetical protein HMPREF0972_00045 [Actinomyces sp. oral taxon 848 str. F0332]|nr:hypothetical protein HMPREF0972_00045 [Actinomyces sp. oral taxon 848 str. F0332]